MTIDQKMIAAANYLLAFYNTNHIFTRQELITLIHNKFGINKASILPSDYCYNRTNNGVGKSTPKLFLHVGRGLYRCVGLNYVYTGPIQHDVRNKLQNNTQSVTKTFVLHSTESKPANVGQSLAQVCEHLFDLSNTKLSDAYYYGELPFCIIDAVFSIGVTYTSTQNTVLRYCDCFNLAPYNYQRASATTVHTISDFISNIEAVGISKSATSIFRNHQRTSSQNGILKAEAVYLFAKILQENNIETFSDLNSAENLSVICNRVKQIPGQKSGLSWQYFLMLSGDDSLAKPDRHVLRFIEDHLGFRPSISEAQQILTDTAATLSAKYSNITVRLLDYIIWEASTHSKLK